MAEGEERGLGEVGKCHGMYLGMGLEEGTDGADGYEAKLGLMAAW